MADVKVYNQQGDVTGTMTLDAKVFDVTPKPSLIEQAVVTLLANRRRPLAHTKTKGEVRGGGRKPWRQKGTGRARQGSIRSPQWKGGGVIFGPRRERSYQRKMNQAAKRQALRMALTDKARHEGLVVVDDLKFKAPKTKLFAAVLKKLPRQKKSLVVLPATDWTLIKSARNIPGITLIRADSLNVLDVVNNDQLIVLRPGLDLISKTYAK